MLPSLICSVPGLSHTCHTEIDETGIFVGIYTIVETWCDRPKTESFTEEKMVAEGGLEPPTRGL